MFLKKCQACCKAYWPGGAEHVCDEKDIEFNLKRFRDAAADEVMIGQMHAQIGRYLEDRSPKED